LRGARREVTWHRGWEGGKGKGEGGGCGGERENGTVGGTRRRGRGGGGGRESALRMSISAQKKRASAGVGGCSYALAKNEVF